MELLIGPQIYSTWSLRGWLVMKATGADFVVRHARYDTEADRAAVAQLVASSFHRTMAIAMTVGVVVTVAGLSITYWEDAAPGAMIVVLAIGLYALTAALRPLLRRRRPEAAPDPHPQLEDDVQLTAPRTT